MPEPETLATVAEAIVIVVGVYVVGSLLWEWLS